MTWATWIIAVASALTAVTDTVVTFRHSRSDRAMFLHHDRRLRNLENGAPK